jgi:fructose-bisphosphate aldolase class II
MCGFKNVTDMVVNTILNQHINVPVALHLDHGSFEGAVKALDAGFSSVMFDGSALAFNDNIDKTKQIIKYAKKFGASVEAEVGSIGGTEDGVSASGELADVEQCRTMAQLPIACLAAGIGNIHGIYPSN